MVDRLLGAGSLDRWAAACLPPLHHILAYPSRVPIALPLLYAFVTHTDCVEKDGTPQWNTL